MPDPQTIFLPVRSRVARKRRLASHAGPTPPVGPLAVTDVVSVAEDETGLNVVLRFNTTAGDPLADLSEAFGSKWSARWNDTGWEGDGIERLTYDTVRVHLIPLGGDVGADVINYSNDPSDIADTGGRQLAAFSGFPLP